MPALAILLSFQLASVAPPAAADHVVTMEILDSGGTAGSDRMTVYRSGRHMRTESRDPFRSQTSYFDLDTGLQVSVLRDRQGQVQRAWIEPSHERATRLPPTGRHDRVLGQDCAVTRVRMERSTTGKELCETADGILLWYAFWYPHPDPAGESTHLYMRATAIERRPVRPEEVLPPSDFLALASAPPPATPASARPDLELEMVGDDPEDGSYVLRRHGRFFSNTRRAPDERGLFLGNGTITVYFSADGAGRPRSLTIERVGFHPFSGLAERWERVRGRAPERVLGETCTWQNNAAIESTDRHYDCRTADGTVLRTETWFHWTGRTQRYTARRLSRRPLTDADFALPARVLDWARWGITTAP